MSWLYERKTLRSEFAGDITLKRLFGRWEVHVGALYASCPYLRDMWRDAYRRLPRSFSAKRVLMLGMAGGDNVMLLAKRFPDAEQTFVEIDPVMVRIADEIGLFPPTIRPRVVIGDATRVVREMDGTFDLACVDIFSGGSVAPEAFSDRFFADIRALLAPRGIVLVNGYTRPELFGHATHAGLQEDSRWKWYANWMWMGSR